ncbi:MAG: polysaccharide biosynthesis tyrosine autokinase [Verrucomicrobiae bacterium]|nr:polysaccharide biosynthesis tyrosine autokinase [Verrucomicrobiae bacterium]
MHATEPQNGNQPPGAPAPEEFAGPDGAAGRPSGGTRVMQANLWDTFQRSLWALRRRAWVVVLIFTVSMAIAVVYLNNQPDVYRAMGKLIVAPRIANIVADAYSDVDPRFYATQVEIMEGSILRGRVSRRLTHFQDRYGRMPDAKLRAELPRISSIFRVWVDSPNGEFARQYVDTLFDEFMKYKREQKLGLSGSALETFAREISEKAKELKIAEDELYQFQKKNPDIYVEGQASAVQKQMQELSAQVVKLQTEIDLLSKLKEYFYQARTGATAGQSLPSLNDEQQKYLQNSSWLDARKELDTLMAQKAQMGTMLKPAHPKMKSNAQLIEMAERRMVQETEKAEVQMQQDIEAKQLQRGVYEKQMTSLTSQNLNSVEKITEYQKLLNNVERTKRLYDEMVSKLSQINVSIDTTQENIQIHEPAILFSTPVSPNRRQTLIIAAVIGIGVGCGLVIAIDRILHKVATPEQVETELGLDLVGVIPRMRISSRRPNDRLFSAHDEQAGFAESFRTLRAVLVQQRKHRLLQVLQITSPQPSEGKTFISANLSATLALGGIGSVLLVGADLRRGDVHRIFDIKSKSGLSEILQGQCDWKSQIFSTQFENLHVIASGKTPPDPARVLQAPLMGQLVEEWRTYYEWVILDCPPLVAISDSIIMAPLADATLMVLRSDSTPTRVAFTALDILSRRARPALGAVLNALDLRRGYYPSYGYYRYQSGTYAYGYGPARKGEKDGAGATKAAGAPKPEEPAGVARG